MNKSIQSLYLILFNILIQLITFQCFFLTFGHEYIEQ